MSSVSSWTTRAPRLTWVSLEGTPGGVCWSAQKDASASVMAVHGSLLGGSVSPDDRRRRPGPRSRIVGASWYHSGMTVSSERTGPFWDAVAGRIPAPPAARTLGWEIEDIDAEAEPSGRVRRRLEFCNPVGAIQGGFLAAMLDDTMGPALVATLEPDQFAPTLELKVSFLRPARPGRLVGTARVVHRGGTIAFLAGELSDPDGQIVATASATARIVRMTTSPLSAVVPNQTERVARRVEEHPDVVLRLIGSERGAQRDRLGDRILEVTDLEVEVHHRALLSGHRWPCRWLVVGRLLEDEKAGTARRGEHGCSRFLVPDRPAEQLQNQNLANAPGSGASMAAPPPHAPRS